MSGATPSYPQYESVALCSVKAQGQVYLYLLPTQPVPSGSRATDRSVRSVCGSRNSKSETLRIFCSGFMRQFILLVILSVVL
jgi:hypothetical protein